MKKIILPLFFLALSLLVLGGCKKEKEFISTKKLESVTLNVSVAQEDGSTKEYVIKRDKEAYSYTQNNKTEYFYDFGNQTYQIENVNDVITSTKSTRDFSKMFEAFASIKESDLDKNADGSYSFKEGTEPKVYSLFMEDTQIDSRTKLKEGYDAGLIEIESTTLTISKNALQFMDVILKYNEKTINVHIIFKDANVTKVTMPVENSSNKGYAEYLNSSNALVTLKVNGYGSIKFELFNYDDETMENIVNYFVYLFKKGKYQKAFYKEAKTNYLVIDSSNKMESTVKAPSKSSVANSRGTIAMMLLNDSDASTQALVINTGDNSSNDSSFIVIGGITEGFDVLDKLAQATLEEDTNIEVKVSIKYNKYKYSKPSLQ